MKFVMIIMLLFFSLLGNAFSDEFRPAYLDIKQVSKVEFDVIWKVPVLDKFNAFSVEPIFPEGTKILGKVYKRQVAGMHVQRWKIHSSNGLTDYPIVFDNKPLMRIDILIRVALLGGKEQLSRLLPTQSEFFIEQEPENLSIVKTYTVIGVEHILLGFDHLLFVLSLLLIVRSIPRLILTISAFTIAHSITLTLATLDIIIIPGPPIEAIIALSIVFIAREILHRRDGYQSLTMRKPWVIAFAFGLLHGVGFAGALAEVGLPENAIPLALLFFNVGVEIGQILFVTLLLFVYFSLKKATKITLDKLELPLVYGIAAIASFWTIERISSFWV